MTDLAPTCFIGFFFLFLQVMWKTIAQLGCSNFGKIKTGTAELTALERLEKSQYTYNRGNVITLVPSFFIIARIKVNHKSVNKFEFLPGPNTELAALERLENQCIMLCLLLHLHQSCR